MYQTGLCQVRLPRLVSDGMVLQRDAPINVWGWANAGEAIDVTFNGQTSHVTTDQAGKWNLKLPAMKAGGPYQLQIRGSTQITLTDIMIGDVWLCSGQSNMALPMERVKERYGEIIAQATNPAIRHFFLPTRYTFQGPMDDLPPGRWESVTPQTVMRFSAVAYFFAKDLYETYHIPIGLINASVGGTPAEAWLSQEALKAFPVHLATAEKLKDSAYVKGIQQSEQLAVLGTISYVSGTKAGRARKPGLTPAMIRLPGLVCNYLVSGKMWASLKEMALCGSVKKSTYRPT